MTKVEGLHLTELFQVLRLRRKLVYFFTVLTVAGAIFRQIFYVPLFTAQTTMNVQKAESSAMQMAIANISSMGMYSIDDSERIQKYLNYLGSSEFFLAAAQNLKFQENYNRLDLTAPHEMALGRKKFWRHFLATNFGANQRQLESKPEPVLVPVEQLALIIQSVTAAMEVRPDGIRIMVTTLDPLTSMILTNTLAEVFIRKIGERDYNEVSEVKKFIQSQLEATTERLKRSELSLVEFKRKHNIISINAEQAAFASKLGSIESELANTRIRFEENDRLIKFYSEALAKSERNIIAQGSKALQSTKAEMAQGLRQQLDNLRQKKVLMQAQGYSEESWQMGEVNTEIDRLAGQLKTNLDGGGEQSAETVQEPAINLQTARSKAVLLQAENRSLQAKISTIDRKRLELLKSLESLPEDEQVLLTLTRDVDLQFELYSSLKKKLQEVEIQQVALQSHIRVAERAEMPAPVPRTLLVVKILFALLVGLFLGGVAAFVLEAIDPTVKHRSDLENYELQTLGSIPHVEGSPIRKTLGGRTYRPDLLICKTKPESPEAMAFKHVRAQLSHIRSTDGKKAQIIAITSAERGDGKTFVAANLAVSLAQLEKKTVLVDCDFRNASAPWLFGYQEADGLTSLLTLKASLQDVLIKDWAPGFDILPAGWAPPNPSELIANEKFRVLLEYLRANYDYIVIDSPPAVAVVDASVIANLADIVILAASFRKTKKHSVLMALQKIYQITHRPIFGLLNNVWEVHEVHSYVYPITGQKMPDLGEGVDIKQELARFEESLTRRKVG